MYEKTMQKGKLCEFIPREGPGTTGTLRSLVVCIKFREKGSYIHFSWKDSIAVVFLLWLRFSPHPHPFFKKLLPSPFLFILLCLFLPFHKKPTGCDANIYNSSYPAPEHQALLKTGQSRGGNYCKDIRKSLVIFSDIKELWQRSRQLQGWAASDSATRFLWGGWPCAVEGLIRTLSPMCDEGQEDASMSHHGALQVLP